MAATPIQHDNTPNGGLAKLSLRRNFSWTFLGNIIFAAAQWGMLVVVAKLGSPEKVGQLALGLAVTAPIMLFSNLQLRSVQATDAKREYDFSHYLHLRIITTILALVVIVGVAVLANYRPESAWVIVLVGVAKSFESFSDVMYGLFQQRERMDRIALSLMLRGPLALVGLGIGMALTDSVVGGALGMAVSWLLVMIFYDIRNTRRLLKSEGEEAEILGSGWDFTVLKRLTWLSLPLGFTMMMNSLGVNIPRYFIEAHQGERELGFFAAMAYLIVAGNIITLALGQSVSPRLSQYYAANKRRDFAVLFLKLCGIGLVLGLGGIFVAVVAGRPLLTLLYDAEYAKEVDVFTGLMVVAAINYLASFMGFAITAARYFKIQAPQFVLITLVTLGASYALIPSRGLEGAVIALLAAAIVQAASSILILIHAIYYNQTELEPEHANPIHGG
jgi:O-antigen/teichoic acid export membrane protein